ncbi:hypothetical protein F5884DRAFT_806158 [Xylogone sp. PMI_703]|nr:hypothetical protein F5884DRAFT_806158 [Xylogone sp. PMI_703]
MEADTQKHLLPEGKHDIAAIEKLRDLGPQVWGNKPIIDELVRWPQDVNWPIAVPVASLLLEHPQSCVDVIHQVVLDFGDDDTWIANLVEYVVKKMPVELRIRLRGDIQNLVEQRGNNMDPGDREVLDEYLEMTPDA